MLYITGDTHGEKARFQYKESEIARTLTKDDYLFICGDWGYIWENSKEENEYLDFLAKKPFVMLFVDGNHENFDLINAMQVEEWCGGKVHIIRRDKNGCPKIIHLMRGQVFEIEGKKIFTFGGAYSVDKYLRTPGISWWEDEMPTDEQMKEAINNLAAHDNKVDYIITHAAPEHTMCIFHPEHIYEKPLNNFLEWVRESVEYRHWWFGHLHRDEDLWRHQTVLWFDLRNMANNERID